MLSSADRDAGLWWARGSEGHELAADVRTLLLHLQMAVMLHSGNPVKMRQQ